MSDKGARRARTRTLIQAGGLLNLTGLLSFFGIEEGQDLQFDLRIEIKRQLYWGSCSKHLSD